MKAHGIKLCCCFLLPISVCIVVNFILAYVTIGSYVSHTLAHLQLFTREVTVTEEMSVIDEPEPVAFGLQLLEISSITTPN